MSTAPAGAGRRARVLAHYLPQYHPIPENDEWWGPGFTEWTNVRAARPLYPGHRQPVVPGELGYYDLRDEAVRVAQAELARAHGVEGFLYWHYWFAGRRLLERPFDEVLRSGVPDLPFALAWANRSWTGVWHGAPNRMLIEQTYPGVDDHRRHFASLLPALTDPRYVCVDGRPLLYVFRADEIPQVARFVETWRACAAEAGLPGVYLVAEVSDFLGDEPSFVDADATGFDAITYLRLPVRLARGARRAQRVARRWLRRRQPLVVPHTRRAMPAAPAHLGRVRLPCVVPNWDNTPRSAERGLVLAGASPRRFRTQLAAAVAQAGTLPEQQRIVFVKSWNEWAEGNHLEPCARFGRGFLDVLRDEVVQDEVPSPPQAVP